MDLIPPYLLSTAFGEQYLLLLAQHQRLATGPAPASFSTTSVTPRIEPSSTTATSTSETTTGPLSSAELASAGIEIPASLIPTTPATAAEDFFEAGSFLDQTSNLSFPSDAGVFNTQSTSQSTPPLHNIASSLWAPPMAPLRAAGAPGGGPRVVSTLPGFRDEEMDDDATEIASGSNSSNSGGSGSGSGSSSGTARGTPPAGSSLSLSARVRGGDGGRNHNGTAQNLDGDSEGNNETSSNDDNTTALVTTSPQQLPLPPRVQTRVTTTTQTGGSPAVIISVIRHSTGDTTMTTTTTSSSAGNSGPTTIVNSGTDGSDDGDSTSSMLISQLRRMAQIPSLSGPSSTANSIAAAAAAAAAAGQSSGSGGHMSLLAQIHNSRRSRLNPTITGSNSGRRGADEELFDDNDDDDDDDDDDDEDDDIDVDDDDEAREGVFGPLDPALGSGSNSGSGSIPKQQSSNDSSLENNSVPPGLLFLGLSPLPTSWVYREVATQSGSDDLAPVISANGLLITYESKSKPSIQETRTLKTNYPIPPLCGVFYYEVDILFASRDTTVSVGLCTDRARLAKVPGHAEHTWGFHSDDGRIISPQDHGSPQAHKFGTGDVVGCGVNFARGSIFFTKNGIHLGEAYTGLEFAPPATFPRGALTVEASTSGQPTVPPLGSTHDIFRGINQDSGRSGTGLNFADLTSNMGYSSSYNSGSSNTRRSNRSGRDAQDNKILEVYPCIGFKPSVKIQTNFGKKEFRFNIERYVKETKDTVMDEILVANNLPMGTYKEEEQEKQEEQEEQEEHEQEGESNGVPLIHADMPEFVQNLVASYFTYMGYVDTAREFQKELDQEQRLNRVDATSGLNEDEDVEMEDATKDEAMKIEDANILNRQKVGQLIVEGHIDAALQLIQKEHPSILEDETSLVIFKLRCLKFVELVKEGPSGLAKSIAYGQELRELYKHDRRIYVQDRLSRTFALLAYELLPNEDNKIEKDKVEGNAEEEEEEEVDPALAALLGPSERYQLAEEVNSLILVSLGQPPVAGIKKMVQHTMAMMWDLQNFRDRLDTSVLNVHQDYLY
ncbi:uncharacterized protein SAPINGB_P006429 [Magnusiomyces paraingens]|uniref:Protein SSH4 n=1 Tax=Magnusiomyces paraingens TaxID=2606893 RepID=A0A5E8C5U1_9ASCO|nr:uncharacterized protein SAPINGB_P006429 [Saprochaete ingens]VVT58877.1 unnamed protein product [Saprochaete ingens]